MSTGCCQTKTIIFYFSGTDSLLRQASLQGGIVRGLPLTLKKKPGAERPLKKIERILGIKINYIVKYQRRKGAWK
jgi:hypothetical protein